MKKSGYRVIGFMVGVVLAFSIGNFLGCSSNQKSPSEPMRNPPLIHDGGQMAVESTSADASVERCNGMDDNGNGLIDEIFLCRLGSVGSVCVTTCGTAGLLLCTAPACSWGLCQPYPENCSDTIDDDCNGFTDCDDPACSFSTYCEHRPDSEDAGSHVNDAEPSVTVDALVIDVGLLSPHDAGISDSTVIETGFDTDVDRSVDASAASDSSMTADTFVAMDSTASTDTSIMDTGTGASDARCDVTVHLSYVGPIAPGAILVEGWWQPPATSARAWDLIPECVDASPGDGLLDCSFVVPCGTKTFEFQVYLPDGRYWGDESFDPTGGFGSTIGTVTLHTDVGPLPYVMIPNPVGAPYFNGYVSKIP